MNDLRLPKLTPKNVFLVLVGALILSIAFSVLSSNARSSLDISRHFASDIAPSMGGGYTVSGVASMDDSVYQEQENVVYRTDSLKAISDTIPTPLPSSPPQGDAKIIKSGDLSLLVASIDDAAAQITEIRKRMNGQAGDSTFSGYPIGVHSGDMTIWVPSDRFDDTMMAIKKLALRVENEQVHASDVSAQYIDTGARLKNLHATEAQYTEIMKRAGTITEVLNVTRELSTTRSEIERLQADLDALSKRVALSSIHVLLSQEAVPGAVTNEWRPLSVAKMALKQSLNDLTDFVDFLIIFVVKFPVLLLNIALWVVIVWGLWKGARFAYRKTNIKTASYPVKDVV